MLTRNNDYIMVGSIYPPATQVRLMAYAPYFKQARQRQPPSSFKLR
jgi:hypothetical protein